MIVLLVAHNIYHLVDRIVVEAHLCRTDVLSHIHRCAVRAEQQLLVEALVREVGPYAVVVLAEEESLLESFLHLCLSLQISLRLIVYLVEAYAKSLVSLVESGVNP